MTIGKPLISSPAFPPSHTERATFTALRVPPLEALLSNGLRPFLRPHYRSFTGSTSTFQQRFGGLSFFARLYSWGIPATFPCSDDPICTYAFRRLLWACWLDSTRRDFSLRAVWHFITEFLTLPRQFLFLRKRIFLYVDSLDPFLRKFVSLFRHSHHGRIIDPRPIGGTVHLWTAFV